MDNRPIKSNPSGKYNLNFVDPTNDISGYYNGMTELQDLIVNIKRLRKTIYRQSLSIK
jgi:hypothetical protein